tara:strand:+ start:1918 stop:2496 length:579 start_codon:yes stop_codon:yes gene_type:complete
MVTFAYANGKKNDPEFIKIKEQLESLQPDKLITENYTSGTNNNIELNKLISHLRKGEKLILYSLESSGRTARQLISLINLLTERGVEIEIIKEGWKTSDHKGQVIAEFSKSLVDLDGRLKQLAIQSGLSKSKKKAGRPGGTYNKENARIAALLYSQKRPIKEIMKAAGIKSKRTLYEYLDIEGVKLRSRRKE